MSDLKFKISVFLHGDVFDDADTLDRYSHDASLFEVRPKCVVFPKDVEDIKNLVKFAEAETKSGNPVYLTPRSGGTDMSGGALSESVIVDVSKYFNNIKKLGDGYAITEPGVYYRDFEKETLKNNLLLPSFPASREICTVGGMVANNSGGEKTLLYGKTEEYIEELNMVLYDGNEYSFKKLSSQELETKKSLNSAEGEIYRKLDNIITTNYDRIIKAKPNISKNSAGYYLWNVFDKADNTFNLNKLIVGSQGTLGIITEIKFRLIKPKLHSRLLVIFLKDILKVAEIAEHVLKFKPESFESYDDHTLKVAIKVFPDLIRKMKGGALKLAWQFLPEFWMTLSGGMPKLILLAQFTADSDQEAQQQVLEAQKSLASFSVKTKVTRTQDEEQKYWTVRRESFNLLRHHTKNMRTAPFIDDIIVRPEKLPEFLPKLYEILDQYSDLIFTVAGHVGDGNFHIIPLMDFRKENTKDIIAELSKKVYSLVIRYGGSITAEHNDGLIRTPFLEQMYGSEIVKLFQEVKKTFDPEGIFNPHKKVGANLEYSLARVIQEKNKPSVKSL